MIPIQNKKCHYDHLKGKHMRAIKIPTTSDPIISLLEICTEEVILFLEKALSRKKFTAGKNWKPPKCQMVE